MSERSRGARGCVFPFYPAALPFFPAARGRLWGKEEKREAAGPSSNPPFIWRTRGLTRDARVGGGLEERAHDASGASVTVATPIRVYGALERASDFALAGTFSLSEVCLECPSRTSAATRREAVLTKFDKQLRFFDRNQFPDQLFPTRPVNR
ncbi:hypothetical protein MRX96_001201 [Rhipicephalus microplus]